MQKHLAGKSLLAVALVLAGAAMGFYLHPLLHPEFRGNSESEIRLSPVQFSAAAQMVAACKFDSEQLDQLAGRLAPLVAQQLGQLSNKSSTSLAGTNEQHASHEGEKAAQAAAFSSATQMIDQMIANHHVSHEGMADAIKMLQQSGQNDRAYELQGRVAAAVNRRELTPEEAGWTFPGSARQTTR